MYLACTKHFDPPEHIEDTGKIVWVPEHISHCTKICKKRKGKKCNDKQQLHPCLLAICNFSD